MDANLAGIIGLIVVAMVIVAFFLAIAYKERELAADALRILGALANNPAKPDKDESDHEDER